MPTDTTLFQLDEVLKEYIAAEVERQLAARGLTTTRAADRFEFETPTRDDSQSSAQIFSPEYPVDATPFTPDWQTLDEDNEVSAEYPASTFEVPAQTNSFSQARSYLQSIVQRKKGF